MRNLRSIIAVGIVGVFIASCANTNNVVSNKLISKRKYTKGFHFNKKSHYGTHGEDVAKEDYRKDSNRSDDLESRSTQNEAEMNYAYNSTAVEENIEIVNRHNNESTQKNSQELDDVEPIVENSESEAADLYEGELNGEADEDVVANTHKQNSRPDTSDPVMLILLVVLAIILPPLAIAIYEGITGRFWLDLVLFLIAWGLLWWILGPLAGLAHLAAIIIALLVILDVI